MKVRTGIKWVAAIMLMVVLCFSVTVAVKGYGMYREAVDSISLEDKVASIRDVYKRQDYAVCRLCRMQIIQYANYVACVLCIMCIMRIMSDVRETARSRNWNAPCTDYLILCL